MQFRITAALIATFVLMTAADGGEKKDAANDKKVAKIVEKKAEVIKGWQPMLAKTFKDETKQTRVTNFVVDRKVGCVFLSVAGQGTFCSSAGANHFHPNKKTWDQVTQIQRNDLDHKFILTNSGIKETRDGGETWSAPIATPKGVVINDKTQLGYDAKNCFLYLMNPGGELYKMFVEK